METCGNCRHRRLDSWKWKEWVCARTGADIEVLAPACGDWEAKDDQQGGRAGGGEEDLHGTLP